MNQESTLKRLNSEFDDLANAVHKLAEAVEILATTVNSPRARQLASEVIEVVKSFH